MTAELLLSTILLGICSWTLLQTVGNGKQLAQLDQKVKDLPCLNGAQACDFQKEAQND